MNSLLNPYRLCMLIICMISYLGMWINGFTHESTMLFVNISMVCNLGLILWNSSAFSTKMILSFLIYIVALVPGLAYYLVGFKLYSYVNFEHQLNDQVTIMMLWLLFLSSNFYTYVVLEQDTKPQALSIPVLGQTRMPFYFICVCTLILAYLADPGRTFLTASYREILEEKPAGATLAVTAMTGFWAIAYAKMRVYMIEKRNFRVMIFWAMTTAVLLWLVLHARRTEAVGFTALLLIHFRLATGKTPWKYIGVALLILLSLYIIGYTRSEAMTDLDVASTVSDSMAMTFEGGGSKTEFANMPSGLGNITASLTTSVYHFYYMGNEFLNGLTIYVYPFKLLPTGLVTGLNLADPKSYYYNLIILDKYFYNGGTYLYAPAYGNFGMMGMIIASILMGLVVNWTQRAMRSNDFFKIVIAAIVIFTFMKTCWYNVLPMIKTSIYTSVLLFYIALVFHRKRKVSNDLTKT